MKGNGKKAAPSAIVTKIVGIRDKWHTKNHPFFQEFAKGKLPLRAIGIFMAQHYQFVTLVLPTNGPPKSMLAEYFVSAQAAVLRLEQLGLIGKGWWDHLSEAGFRPADF